MVACGGAAHADEDSTIYLRETSWVQECAVLSEDGRCLRYARMRQLAEDRYAVPRWAYDEARGALEAEPRLEKALASCVADLKARIEPSNSWLTAAKWAGFGVAMSAAFAAGVLVAR
jgi:hypothetical protein